MILNKIKESLLINFFNKLITFYSMNISFFFFRFLNFLIIVLNDEILFSFRAFYFEREYVLCEFDAF